MTKPQLRVLALSAATSAVLGLAWAPQAHAAGTVLKVDAGESVQRALDAARPGDTVYLGPGTYRESIQVKKSGVTVRGAGDRTVLVPATTKARKADACAAAGNGICVEGTAAHPLKGVRISNLTVRGFKKNGVWASRTDELVVHHVMAEKNGTWGIAQERSTEGRLINNTARANGDAGIFLANTVDTEAGATDTDGTLVRGNDLVDNRIGVTVRRLREVRVEANDITANCAGVMVVGDENKPRVGDITVRLNHVHHNNKFCAANSRLPAIQGAGIVLTGAEKVTVVRNTVEDNKGTTPMSGGIVLFKSFVGALNENNTIQDNTLQDNGPADLADRDTAKTNTFQGNTCGTSEPAALCGNRTLPAAAPAGGRR
ncbi:nitrous oxide reductase family maturation protein NosD [Streptomyces griseoaurantiacus]|uniref:right-handed parallel beta-helix repeat-containing protein n=1 Tax=Streptomyces griseoaurantiacus TaxID=68213 RepID=UPI0036977B2A